MPGETETAAGKPEMSLEEVLESAGESAGVSEDEPLRRKRPAVLDGKEPEGEPEGEEIPAEEVDQEAEEHAEELKGMRLPAEVQERLNRRFGKLTKARREAEAKATEAEARAATAEERVAAAEKLAQDEERARAYALGLPPEYLGKEEAAVLAKDAELRQQRALLRPYRTTGYEGENGKSYTAEQIQERLDAIADELGEVGGRAREIRDRRQAEMLRHLRLGREAEAKGKTADAVTRKPATGTRTIEPPPIAAGVGAARRPPVSAGRAGTTRQGFDAQRLMADEGGVTLDKLQAALEGAG